ncbi:hypothetical protein Droror1_Dr00010049 [Drosera rotundifolia]
MAEVGVVNLRLNMAEVIAGVVLSGILLLLCGFCIWRIRRLKSSHEKTPQLSGSTLKQGGQYTGQISAGGDHMVKEGRMRNGFTFEYHTLEVATNNFQESNKLDDEGLVCTYKALLNENSFALVQQLDARHQGMLREFENILMQNEVELLSKIQHQNIVTLLGHCINGEARFLVHEMMQNGSLEQQLHGPSRGLALTWPLRIKIALDVARGLEYLHEHCKPPLIHGNLRPSNILLDSKLNAKLSGFGHAVGAWAQSKNHVGLSGTLDYIAPEYLLNGKLTDKCDVYAFGVVLLELLTGRKPEEKMLGCQNHSIVTWVMPQFTDRLKLPTIVDPVIRDQMDQKHLFQVAAVAVLCVQPEPSYRPLITDVLHSLIPLVPNQLGASLRDTLAHACDQEFSLA